MARFQRVRPPIRGLDYGAEFPTPLAARASDFPNLVRLVDHEFPALDHFFDGLAAHYPKCVAEGRLAKWAELGHHIIDMMAAPLVEHAAPQHKD